MSNKIICNKRVYEPSTMSDEDLYELRGSIVTALNGIRDQLMEVGENARENGIYADQDWLNRTFIAQRAYEISFKKVQRHMYHRSARQARQRSISENFVEIAREALDEKTFGKLWSQAKEVTYADLELVVGAHPVVDTV